MRKLTPLFLIFAAFFFVAVAVGLAYSHYTPKPTEVVHPVALLGDHAEPAQLIIRIGEIVRFDNGDGVDHALQQRGSADAAQPVPAREDYHLHFDHAGTFDYFDTLHPTIQVKIIVYDPSK